MGPKIFQKQKSETKYSLRALPIGGYVAMEGEDETSSDPRSFDNAPVLKRMAVVLAGPAMNFLLAIVLLAGFYMFSGIPTNSNEIGQVVPSTTAFEIGLQANDRILSMNGIETKDWKELLQAIQNSKNKKSTIKIDRNNKIIEKEFTLTADDSGQVSLGIMQKTEKSILGAFGQAFKTTGYFIALLAGFLGMLFKGQLSFGDVSGPIGVVKQIGTAANMGIATLIYLVSFINVNLGFFNLLPFPALDGGRFVFLAIEFLAGKRVPKEKEGIVHFVGIVILLGLMVIISIKDVMNLG